MTIEEHSLLITMFARQAILLKALADIMRSHDLLAADDIKLFDAFVLSEENKNLQIFQKTAKLYSDIAGKLGLDVPVVPPAASSSI
jgi:hypothetical protein